MTTRTLTTAQIRAFYIDESFESEDWYSTDGKAEREALAGAEFDAWHAAHTLTTQINAFRDCIEWLSNEELHGQDARTAARLAAELDEFLAEKYGEPTAEQLSAANAAREVTA